VLVLSFAMIASGVRIGDFCYISSYAHAGTGAAIGNYTSLMGGATVGDSVVGDGCVIGLKSACIDGAVVGDGATVAPYTCVRRTVPAGALIAGSPARIIKPRPHRPAAAGEFYSRTR
jgi:acetyltransferase-like isoleucine patch superfamily enzyme